MAATHTARGRVRTVPPRSRADEVVLLDEQGNPSGTADRLTVHTTDTPLHLAFSTYLFNARGEVLLTRRSLDKLTWPGVWTNSCCGHPRPGEAPADAARRRIGEELGLVVGPLTEVLPHFRYRAVDAGGIVENEMCPVFVGFVTSDELHPDPAEVAEAAWIPWPSLVAAVRATPQVYSPWSVLQVRELAPRLPRLVSSFAAATHDPDACLADVDALLRDELADLTALWERFNDGMGVDVLPHDLPRWLEDLLVGRGKRLRVMMAYWGFVAAGGRTDQPGYTHLVRAAAALETLHLFALVHDDVMDESASRRGRPAAHVEAEAHHRAAAGAHGASDVFGRNMAVLLGDLAHTLADKLIDPLPRRMRAIWSDLCIELIAGQRADLTGAAAGRRDRAHAEHIARLKSGCYTIERPLELGAAAANASPEVVDQLNSCGRLMGSAFALRDDVLGIWGDPERTGKPAGDDLAEAKATVIMALAAERLRGPSAEALERLATRLQRPGDLDLVRDALVTEGVRDEVEQLIAAEVTEASACLEASGLVPAGIEGLKAAARRVAWRES